MDWLHFAMDFVISPGISNVNSDDPAIRWRKVGLKATKDGMKDKKNDLPAAREPLYVRANPN